MIDLSDKFFVGSGQFSVPKKKNDRYLAPDGVIDDRAECRQRNEIGPGLTVREVRSLHRTACRPGARLPLSRSVIIKLIDKLKFPKTFRRYPTSGVGTVARYGFLLGFRHVSCPALRGFFKPRALSVAFYSPHH
jgi:hypothetical protein